MSAEFSHNLTSTEVLRFSRQIIVEEFGPEGQQKLKESSLLIVGAGALGVPVLLYCAAAGIGRLGIADDEKVTEEVLKQQFIHTEAFIGCNKVDSAEAAIKRLNSSLEVKKYSEKLTDENALNIFKNYDYIVDCTNTSSSSFSYSKVCSSLKKTLVMGRVNSSGGKVVIITAPKSSSCKCCSFSEKTADNDDDKSKLVLGPVFGFIGCLMVTEIVKLVSSVGCQRSSSWRSDHCTVCSRIQLCYEIPLYNIVTNEKQSLRQSSLLIVGSGGLGSPVALYCATAGIGRIGIVDHDVVSIDNLHRQVAYDETVIGMSKAESLRNSVLNLNSKCSVEVHDVLLNKSNAKPIIEQYDIIADCSDNISTRCLISDFCAVMNDKKQVVSGSALSWDGQLTVYNHMKVSLCFRCLHPKAIPPSCSANCSDNGVIGSVVGVIGSLQALEILRIAMGNAPSYAGKLFVYDGYNGYLRDIILRSGSRQCSVCNGGWNIEKLSNHDGFYNMVANDETPSLSLIALSDRITPREAHQLFAEKALQPYLIDTRPPHQYRIGHLQSAINIPFEELLKLDSAQIVKWMGITEKSLEDRKELNGSMLPFTVLVICRRGNHSQLAVLDLRKKFSHLSPCIFRDIIGGYTSWQHYVDASFPIY